ncbi:Uncharacterised protein [Mycobacteroides abscessus subsp. massiliense]|nr:Uncharacterised protein [Mycobacteroides abscessus subsp. massiliense]
MPGQLVDKVMPVRWWCAGEVLGAGRIGTPGRSRAVMRRQLHEHNGEPTGAEGLGQLCCVRDDRPCGRGVSNDLLQVDQNQRGVGVKRCQGHQMCAFGDGVG